MEGSASIEGLDLSGSSGISDVSVTRIGECLSDLEYLDLYLCPDVKNKDLTISINLAECSSLTNASILKIAEGCPYLSYLNLAATTSQMSA